MTLMAMILGTWKFTKAAEICKAYRCSNQTREGVCAESTADTVVLNPSTCGDKEECFFSGNETGQCAPKIDRNFPSLYYPGYNCRYEKKPGICAFGGKYCNKYGMCEGGSLDDICQRHADCHYGFYCNPFGFCVPSKEEGEACTQNEECIRGYGCFRKCIKYLSLETDEQVIPEFNRKVFSQLGNEKMCESGWYNRTTGRCFSGVKSLQKGKICSTDLDCPTTVEDIFAQCKCGFSVKGQKYCDIEGDDDEWQEVLEAFGKYANTTRESCHPAEGLGECFFNNDFKKWKCLELKARLYVYFIDQPDCYDDIKVQHPIFAEYLHYCKG
ncbi:unnamed protein product [Moneuplotes crassus]|uniref:Uncharacterized protein n=1 Tax=Euplotes crassus TaxID=5936 RepID=A0AAD1UMP7_EUPCR|nr:unnamed protein product [Moneuplotes crassus]